MKVNLWTAFSMKLVVGIFGGIVLVAASFPSLSMAYSGAFSHTSDGRNHATTVAKQRLLQKSSFEQTWSRYPAPDMILMDLRRDFPRAAVYTQQCRELSPENRLLLGDSVPQTGRPAVDLPNQSFVAWYSDCLSEYVRNDAQRMNYSSSRTHLAEYTSTKIADECLTAQPLAGDPLAKCEWLKMSLEARREFVRRIINEFIGPEDIIQEQELAATEDDLVSIILDEVNEFATTKNGRYDFLGTHPRTILWDPSKPVSTLMGSMVVRYVVKLLDIKY